MFVRFDSSSLVLAISSSLRVARDGTINAVTIAENKPSFNHISIQNDSIQI
jgi:hypothetical protein